MKLLRFLAEAYRSVSPKDLHKVSRQAWASLAAFLFGLLRDSQNELFGGDDAAFFGDAFRATSGPGLTVDIAPGFAVLWDDGQVGEFEPKMRPLLQGDTQTLDAAQGGAQARTDAVFVQTNRIWKDYSMRWFKDPDTEREYKQESPSTEDLSYELAYRQGQPGQGAPPAPDRGGPWIKICEIDRAAGQTTLNDSDITDTRPAESISLGELLIQKILKIDADGAIEWSAIDPIRSLHDTAKDRLKFERESGALADLWIGDLWLNALRHANGGEVSVSGENGPGSLRVWNLIPYQSDPVSVRDSTGSGYGTLMLKALQSAEEWLDARYGSGGWSKILASNVPYAHGVYQWDSTAGEWVEQYAVNFAPPASNSDASGAFLPFARTQSQVGDFYVHVNCSQFSAPTGFDWVAADASIADDGSGDAQVGMQFNAIDLTNDTVQAAVDVEDGFEIKVVAYYDPAR